MDHVFVTLGIFGFFLYFVFLHFLGSPGRGRVEIGLHIFFQKYCFYFQKLCLFQSLLVTVGPVYKDKKHKTDTKLTQ